LQRHRTRPPWGPDPLTGLRTGGGIAWAIGEAPAVLVALILFRQWIRDDEREQRRLDRAADRDGPHMTLG
jgi:cytochrome c oxidase assembly factor CtaG